jgi:carotenoid 1,2-hydratase
MPTVAMHETTNHADASHQVTAPGGYEWWYFDAEDPQQDVQVVAILLDGFVFHPGYLRADARYRRRPTRVKPAVPADYPCAYFVVYRGGRIWRQFMTQFPPGSLKASTQRPEVTVGPNSLRLDGDDRHLSMSGTPWRVTGRGPQLLADETLTAELTFTPTLAHPPLERIFLSRAMTGADHHWVIANPLCSVSGTITCAGESLRFAGRGYHDHNYGTGPLGPGLKRWIWGRVLLDDQVTTFHYARPLDARLPDEVHLVQADASGVAEVVVQRVEADWSRKTALRLAYPQQVRFDDTLTLTRPRVVDPSPFYLRLIYDAQVGGRSGQAFCEIAYPHRLRWPILGRMIEMSIDKRTLQ